MIWNTGVLARVIVWRISEYSVEIEYNLRPADSVTKQFVAQTS